jgi:ATP-dependent helicase/nuclease subunit A
MSEIIQLTTAGAGSGKTTELTRVIAEAIRQGACRPDAIIATTFTNKAAEELIERVRGRLFGAGRFDDAQRLEESLLGTVHSICARLLGRFAFEAGISPEIVVIDEDEASALLHSAIEEVCQAELITRMEELSTRFCQHDDQTQQNRWKEYVGAITKAARENGIAPEELAAMAETNIAELLAFLPPPSNDPLEALLKAGLEAALAQTRDNGDKTTTTADARNEFVQALKELDQGCISWAQWYRTAKVKVAKLSAAAAKPAQSLAWRVEEHPALRAELGEYIRGVFSAAEQALVFYQQRKEERGWVDFADLEARTLALLTQPTVAEVIAEEFDLLLVDEFQDTSPLQLALFLRLAELVRVRTVWVGDVKQAIYGFRGSDPELMNAAVQLVRGRGGLTPPLNVTYRARPELARFINRVFVPPFGRALGLASDEVALRPDRVEHPELTPPLEQWLLSSGQIGATGKPKAPTNAQAAAALAEGVAQLLVGGYQVEDKPTGNMRPLEMRDVALLCRTNDSAMEVAGALLVRGIAATRETPGLLSTPEAYLALACLRRLVDPGDSLAAAEVIALTDEGTVEEWLAHRLEWLESSPEWRWGLEGMLAHAGLLALEKAHGQFVLFTPREALDCALQAGGAFRAVTAWGPTASRAAQRRANLEALRGLALKYEDRCETSHHPATVAGFLLWCSELQAQNRDGIAIDEKANAVNVLTWHGAKGLEWPVVICTQLESEPRSRSWDQVVVVQETAIDSAAPLRGRRVRFWPWPFGRQPPDKIPLGMAVAGSPAGQAAERSVLQEELRLLYVAFTRARDVLILPYRQSQTPFAIEPLEAGDWLMPRNPAAERTEATVGDFPARLRRIAVPEAQPAPACEAEFRWFPTARARNPKLAAEQRPHAQPALASARIGKSLDFQQRLNVRGNCEEENLGNALHALLAFEMLHPSDPDRVAIAERLLHAHGLEDHISAADALTMIEGFRREIEARFNSQNIHVEAPFDFTTNQGQRVSGVIDLLLQTATGWVVVDHKTFLGKRSDWRDRALAHSGQLALYVESQAILGRQPCSAWIHFVTGGGLVEVHLH